MSYSNKCSENIRQGGVVGGSKYMHENVVTKRIKNYQAEEIHWVRLLKCEAITMKISWEVASRQREVSMQSLNAGTDLVIS